MITAIDIHYEGAVQIIRSRQARNRVLKLAFQELGREWGDDYLPDHFTRAGARKYGYAERSRGYTARKRKQHGHIQPLKFTGRLEEETRGFTVAPSTAGVKVRVPGRALNLTNIPNSQVNMREEISTVTPDERRDLADYGMAFTEKLAQRVQGKTRRRI